MDDLFNFSEEVEDESKLISNGEPWRILIVDDNVDVHNVTKFIFKEKILLGKRLELTSAYSLAEAKELLRADDNFALAYIDVVMEEEDSGLQLIEFIRNELKNNLMRLTIRTGQPGAAPEEDVIVRYDINDYREKTDMNARRLFCSAYTAIRGYREIIALNDNRIGLKKVIESSGNIHGIQRLSDFGGGVLEQLASILYQDKGTLARFSGMAAQRKNNDLEIIATAGSFNKNVVSQTDLEDFVVERMYRVFENKKTKIGKDYYAGYFTGHGENEYVLYMHGSPIDLSFSEELLELFCRNVSIARENNELKNHVEATQKEIVYLLGEAVERRSEETGNHVRRVAHYSRLLAKLLGLSLEECEEIYLASPLHDLGKIAIPDAILNKPGKLNAEEWEKMQKHAVYGYDMLSKSKNSTLLAASIVAHQHHEKWNGTGYPNKLSGKDIHIFGRITALADVFDALGSDRCYKDAWPFDAVLSLIKNERGEHFDPQLVDVFVEHIDDFIAIRDRYSDV